MSNIARHTLATQALARILYSPGSLTLQVVDDSVGFIVSNDPSGFAPAGHYGVLGLQEWAELIVAMFKIQSSPGSGTHLPVTLPV